MDFKTSTGNLRTSVCRSGCGEHYYREHWSIRQYRCRVFRIPAVHKQSPMSKQVWCLWQPCCCPWGPHRLCTPSKGRVRPETQRVGWEQPARPCLACVHLTAALGHHLSLTRPLIVTAIPARPPPGHQQLPPALHLIVKPLRLETSQRFCRSQPQLFDMHGKGFIVA